MKQKYIKLTAIAWLVGISAFSEITTAQPHITTATLIRATAQALPHCLHYRIKGACYWWVKDGAFGHPEVTLKVAHYIPDVVVSVFDRPGDNPLLEANYFYDKPAYKLAKKLIKAFTGLKLGDGRHSFANAHDTQVRFKEVSIIGNPAAHMLGKDITISPNAIAFMPYFNSFLDVMSWRFGTEMLYPDSWNPWAHPIGKTRIKNQYGNSWGHLYPRDGFVVAANDAIASAVIAQRAVDIITKRYQPHAYRYLKRRCGSHCKAAAVKENDRQSQWQRLFPVESHQCHVFGGKHGSEDHLATQTKGRYVWILWRYYEGCIPAKGGKYLSETHF